MKHRPFEKALAKLLNDEMTSQVSGEDKMVTAAETKAKKNRSTKAAVKKGVMAARKYLRQHPHATLQDLITHTGLSGPTLSRHLTKVGKKKASKKGPHQDKAEDFMMLTEAYNKAKEELDAARENLIAFIQTGKL